MGSQQERHSFVVVGFFPPQEKQDKVVLLAEMANLRENNQRLQEESLTASEQLRKFNVLFTNLKTGSDHETQPVTQDASSQRE